MTADRTRILAVADRPGLQGAVDALVAANLPEFMMWGSPGNWRWHRIYELFPELQLCVVDGDGSPAAAAHAVPVRWDGEPSSLPGGFDDVLVGAVDHPPPDADAVSLLSITVAPRARGSGLPGVLVNRMKDVARARGGRAVVAPLRLTHKSSYPLIPIEAYAAWTVDSGEAFDPWLRTHVRIGGEVAGFAPRSLVMTHPVSRWEGVAGVPLPGPGSYVIEGALAPIEVDDDAMGTYAEPNVWIAHWCRQA